MIIFKLILASFKQNLRPGVQNFILGAQIYIYIYTHTHIYIYIFKKKKARSGGSFGPSSLKIGKYLGTSGVRRNGTPSSYIHGGSHHEFNERTSYSPP